MITQVYQKYPELKTIITQLTSITGVRVLLVGGAVRDILLGELELKDLDLEVYGLTVAQLETELSKFGTVMLVGQAFGVLRLSHLNIDWSLPRSDSAGRKPVVQVDPNLSLQAAFRRRDLTINAMGLDLVTGELIDLYHGQQDLKNKILRAVDSELFSEDPLRFFRVMSFIGRFEFQPDLVLNNLCKTMDLTKISRERIEQEFQKLFLKSQRPSLGIRWLQELDRLKDILPELYHAVGVPQNIKWHPEGDVFEHSMQALDAVIREFHDGNSTSPYTISDQVQELLKSLKCDLVQLRILLCWAAICHDLGKAVTTKLIDGLYRSFGHEIAGVELSKKLLKRVTEQKDLLKTVPKLVLYHMRPGQYITQKVRASTYKKLALQLAPDANLLLLAQLARADRAGRNGDGSHLPLKVVDQTILDFITRARALNIILAPELPILTGQDLLALNLVTAGPELGKLLAHAYDIQISQGITDKAVLLQNLQNK
ncbi:MAG TPA: HD domain-containing protein [Candidatus Babeliales bacterium]|nr:HD domain-containing protein [Candidatus Babeliales bacterium]